MENIKFSIGMVESSGGRLVINLKTGKILNCFVDNPEYREQFESIDYFDMTEWHTRYPFDDQVDCFDILDLGYTTKDGKKISPDHDFRYQSHWDHVYELKQMLIEEVIMHIKQDIENPIHPDALELMIDNLPIPDLFHYLPEHHLHDEKFKYLIDQGLIDYDQFHNDGHQYLKGLVCPQCRTPIGEFDEHQLICSKCNVLITIKKVNK